MQDSSLSLLHNSTVDLFVTTIYDAVSLIRTNQYDEGLKAAGFLPFDHPVRGKEREEQIQYTLLRILLNPSSELCGVIQKYITAMKNHYSIGLQLRVGGKMKNANDAVFLGMERIRWCISRVKRIIRQLQTVHPILFLSTDSIAIQQVVVDSFYPIQVLYVTEYQMGHSASRYGKHGGKETWEEATKRAIIDIMVLKECDHLMTTHNSSFGGIAVLLQQSYELEVSVDSFLKERGLKCSAFTNRSTIGTNERV